MAEAVVVTVAVVAGNTLLRPLVNAINRASVDELTPGATYEVRVLTGPEHVGKVRDELTEALEKASYPIRDIEVVERSEDVTELAATLISTAADPTELDAVTSLLEASPLATHASWSSSAEE